MTMLYFGVWDSSTGGHFLYRSDGYSPPFSEWPLGHPFESKIDTGFCPETNPYQDQGVAALTRKGGWTVLAFWDRTGDHRPGSNSAFLEEGTLTFDDMVARAKAEFPEVWKRFTFEVRLIKEAK